MAMTHDVSALPEERIVDLKEEWFDGDGRIFLIWAILNPNGPTLYVLGTRDFDGRSRVFCRWLHMLGGGTTYAAETTEDVSYQRIFEDAQSIHRHLIENGEQGLFHVIPSLVIVSGGDETIADIAVRLLTSSAAAQQDWGRDLAFLRQYRADFFARAGAEIRQFHDTRMTEVEAAGEEVPRTLKILEMKYGHLKDFRDAMIPTWTPSLITQGLFAEWWQTIQEPGYRQAGLAALRTMWEGASSLMSDDSENTLVSWDTVIDFVLAHGFQFDEDEGRDEKCGGELSGDETENLIRRADEGDVAARRELLERAAETGDPRARFNLGLQQSQGIGMPADMDAAMANFIMASLGGFPEARDMLEQLKKAEPERNWENIFDRVRWAELTFIMGPLAKGHLDKLTKNREQDDGADNAPWLEYERRIAQDTFLSSSGEGSILDIVFGRPAHVEDLYVGRAFIGGQTYAAITINMRNIVDSNGFPVCRKPPEEELEALCGVIGMLSGREWVRSSYTTF